MPNTDDLDPCVVCTTEQAESMPASFDGIHQVCPRCGEFKISGNALAVIAGQALGNKKRAKLSGWILAQNRAGEVPIISTTNLDSILSRSLPPVIDRATDMLLEAEHGLGFLGDTFNIYEPRFLAATYSANSGELDFFTEFLIEQGLINRISMSGTCQITPHGYVQLDELRKKTSTSSQGFVAMWFDRGLDTAYSDGLQEGILRAGYDAIRIDRVEHVNKIDDEIIRQLKGSKFVVADFTGHRGGVYFEAGFALGLDMPVFWTCRKDNMDELHFDIRQFNCIDWETPEELAGRLAARIEAVLGPGPNK